MVDADAMKARKGHSGDDHDSTTVPMAEIDSTINDQYPNPFQHQQHHVGHGNDHVHGHQQPQYYNIMIPPVGHWPVLFINGLQISAVYIIQGLQQARAKFQNSQFFQSGSYQALPTATLESSRQSNARPTFSFGSKRQQKSGHHFTCSGRRLSRILIFLILLITSFFLIIPNRLNPLDDRAIWIRFYNHEEAIKIMLPYGRKLQVAEVKTIAMKELHNGFSSFHPGNVKVISRRSMALRPDDVWDNRHYEFQSTARHPILVVETKSELFSFLNSALDCFSNPSEYMRLGRSPMDAKFTPPNNDYSTLAWILEKLANNDQYFDEYLIYYLREAFNDPKMYEPRTGRPWTKPASGRLDYVIPDIPLHRPPSTMSNWEPDRIL